MRQQDGQRMANRYRRAVEAYAEISDRIEAAIPGATARSRRELRLALDRLLPVLGDCIAELPQAVAELAEKIEALRLLHRQAEAAGLTLRYREVEEGKEQEEGEEWEEGDEAG